MRNFARNEIPRDLDYRLVKILRDHESYLEQVTKGFGAIERGSTPSGGGGGGAGGTLALNDHHKLSNLTTFDDHTQYLLLAGRTDGQSAYGSSAPAPSVANPWTAVGAFVSESQKSVPLSSWPIAIDTSAEVGETVIIHIVTPPYAAGVNGTTSNHTALTDTGVGNTFTKVAERTYSDVFSNGCCHSIWYGTLTVALTAGSHQLTATFNASANAMAAVGHRFRVAAGTIIHSGTASLGEEGFVGNEPSALAISGLTPGLQYLFFRATGKGQAGSTVIGTYNPSPGHTALDHNGSITAGGTGNVGSCGEYKIAAGTGDSTDPQLGSAGGHFSSMLVAFAVVPVPDGFLRLAAQDTLLASKMEMIDSDIYLYGDTFNFRDAGGTSNVLTIRGSDGFFVDGIETDDLNITASIDLTTAASQSVITETLTLTGTGAGAGGIIQAYNLTVSGGSGLTSGSYGFTGLGITANPVIPSGVTGTITGLSFLANASGAGALSLVGGTYSCYGSSTPGATASQITALEISLNALATTTTTARALFVNGLSGTWSGATTSAIAIDVSGTFANDADVATWFGLRISTGVTAAIANKWSLSLTNTSTNMGSRVSHPTAIGWTPSTVSAITARLMLAAGTATASTSPLKFQTGTSLTTAEAGAMEFTTDDLFFTITTGAARKRLLMADPVGGLTATRVPFATTNGRLTDNAAMTFAAAVLTVPSLVDSALTAGRVTFAGTAGLLTDDAGFTFAAGLVTAASLASTALTSGRVTFAGASGVLTDDADFTFATDTLTVTKIAATTLTGLLTFADAIDIAVNTGTGTKIGTGTAQKIGFWNTAPIAQPTTAVAAATFVTNTSLIADDSATFDGYTLGQVVRALRLAGLLA